MANYNPADHILTAYENTRESQQRFWDGVDKKITDSCEALEKRLTEQFASAASSAYQMSAMDVRMSCVSLMAKNMSGESAGSIVEAADTLAAFVLNGKKAEG
jgi:hypothetical protein